MKELESHKAKRLQARNEMIGMAEVNFLYFLFLQLVIFKSMNSSNFLIYLQIT
jgi:hypothetical protein